MKVGWKFIFPIEQNKKRYIFVSEFKINEANKSKLSIKKVNRLLFDISWACK